MLEQTRLEGEQQRGPASGRGVAPTCNTVLTPGRGVARRRGEWWSVAASGGVNTRRWGMRADLPSGAAAGCSNVGAWTSEGAVKC